MKPQPARKASTNSAAASRSAFFACLGAGGSAENAGSDGCGATSTALGAGDGVPMTRRGPSGSPGYSLMPAALDSGLGMVPPLGVEPHGNDHEEAEPAEPAEQALAGGAGAAKREAAGVGLFPRGDDV